jgi:hypothetical protein
MALTPEERAAWLASVNEIALAINDRILATTAQARQAAQTRFINGMKAHDLLLLNALKYGSQGGYTE